MSQEEQDRIFKAINNVSKKVMAIQKQLDDYFSQKHEESTQSISITEDAIIELASLIDEANANKEGGHEE